MSSNGKGGGLNGDRLPSQDVYMKLFTTMLNQDPQTVARMLDKMLQQLRMHRMRVYHINDMAKYEYAKPIFNVPIEKREDLFEVLETLVDRHGSELVREKVLQLQLEFGAIEDAPQGEVAFGMTSLTSLGNLMRSSRTIENIFVTKCLIDPLCPIINGMSGSYLGIVAKEIASWIKVTSYPQEFAEGLAACAKKLGKSFQMSLPLAQAWWEKGNEDPEKWAEHAGSNAYNHIAEIIHFSCRSPAVARMYVPELAIVLYTKTEVFHELIKPSYIRNNLVLPPYKLISALASAVPEAAAFFAGPSWNKQEVGIESYNYYQQLKSSLNHQRMMKHLTIQVSNTLWEEADSSIEPMTAAYYLHTLFSLMSHSSMAVKEFYDDVVNVTVLRNSGGKPKIFAVQLLKRAEYYAQISGDLCNAFLRGMVLLTDRNANRPAEQASFHKEIYNDEVISEMSKHLQETAHKLLTTTAEQRSEASRVALRSICEIYKNFNDASFVPHIKHITAEYVPNYSRDLILFHILDINANQSDGGYVLIDDSVRLAASDCLTTLDCNNFSHQGIQYLLDTFSTVPTVISPLKFHVMTTLMYFLFKLAVFEAPDKYNRAMVADDNKQGIDSPGRVFRSLYASEIGNCIFSLLERLVIDGSLDQATYWEIRFVQTCIKFLMTGWIKYEFHADNLGSRPIEILTNIITREQSRLEELTLVFEERKKRYYTLIEQRRCVVSEEDLSMEEDQRVGQAGAYRLPPIRLKRHEHVVINEIPYQHSYIEQTSFGGRVSFLFQVIAKLKKIDIVAFRLIHQMCNTICDISMVNSIQKLTALSFEDWNNSDPGKSIEVCDKDEQDLFHMLPNTSHSSVYTVKTFNLAKVDDAKKGEDTNKESKEEQNIKSLYEDYMKNMRKDVTDAKGDTQSFNFKPIYDAYVAENKVHFAFKVEERNELLAFCLARPYTNYSTQLPKGISLKPIHGNDITAEQELETVHKKSIGHGFIMIDHYYFKPSKKDQIYDAHRALLATLSHSGYQYGFNRCFIVADRHLRPSLAKSGANLISNDHISRVSTEKEAGLDSSMNLFYWYTRDNIWSFSQNHTDYVSNRIPETLLQLLLDDQNTQKIEEMKRQGKMPTKNIVKRFKCKIRNKMEEFGGQLTTEFEGKSDTISVTPIIEDILNIDLTGDSSKKDDERQRMFGNLIEKEFKYGLVNFEGKTNDKDGKPMVDTSANGGTRYNTNPLWERISGGTKEETLIECVSRITPAAATAPQPLVAAALLSQLPPDLNPRNNPDRYVNDWMRNELAASAREIGEINAGGDGKLLQKDVENELRRRNIELEEQEKSRKNDEIEAEKRRNEWKLPPLLQRWTVPSTAAILRSLYIVLTKSQRSTFDTVLSNLISVPNEGMGILEALRAVLTSFQYQLRASVLDALPESNYNIALKILEIITASLGRVSSGLNAALASLEYVELCLEVVKDICRLLCGLIQSRNNTYIAAANQGMATIIKGKNAAEFEANDSTVNAIAAGNEIGVEKEHNLFKNNIDSTEERVMVGVCKTLSALINQVNYITLFKGSSQLISDGNRKCRQHAQQQLFTSSSVLCDTVLSILLYDLEKENDVDSVESRSKSFASLRDQARIYATELLANFMHVDRVYKYNFFNEFCVANIKADRSIRASFIQQVILRSNSLRFRDKLDPYLRSKNVLGSDEYILNFGFVEYSNSDTKTDSDGTKLFIITNQAYYVSHITYDADIESKLLTYLDKDYKMAQFVFVEKRQFSDIIRLYRDFSSHGFAIRSYVANAKDRLKPDNKDIRRRTDVFIHRSQGMVDNLLQTLANYARDDTYHIHNIATDEFTPAALIPLFQSCLPDGRLQNLSIKLMTHCWVIRRDGTIVKRLLMWVNDNGNHANSSIIITPYSAGNWDPTVGGEDLQDIKFAQSWEPAKYPKCELKNDLVQQISNKCGDTQRIQSLFNVSSASVLPNFMAAMPSLPFGNLSEGGPFHFPVSEIQSVDFTEDHSTDMIIRIRRVDVNRIPSVYVRFADDTGREIWRRELKKLFFGGTMGTWSENILPDLSENSRRKNELL